MTEQRPAPLVPAEIDCTDLDGFMLNVERLMASELVALSSHEVIGAAVLLWCRAWKQRPAASLPNDDKVIAAFARMPMQRFRKLRDEVLRGFVLCNDGRLYHATLSREAVRAYELKKAFRRKREADAERLRKWRSGTKHETPNETHRETRFVAEGQDRTGQDRTLKKREREPDAPSVLASRASRLPPTWTLPADWEAWAKGERPDIDPQHSAERFRDYWVAQPGTKGRKTDWLATWRNWVRSERATPQAASRHANGTEHEPEWRRQQREHAVAFLGPAASAQARAAVERTRPATTQSAEVIDATARLLG